MKWVNKLLSQRIYSPGDRGLRNLYLFPVYIKKLAICVSGDKIIGCAAFASHKYDCYVFVKPKYRRQGIGKKLIQLLELNIGELKVFKSKDNIKFWSSI